MSPIAIDSQFRMTGSMLAILLAFAALIAGFAAATAFVARHAASGAPSLASLAFLASPDGPGTASLAGDFEVASANAAGPAETPEFWSPHGNRFTADAWLRTQLVRLPDGAAAHLNSAAGTTWVVQVFRTYATADGQTCRDFAISAEGPVGTRQSFDTACRHTAGRWTSRTLSRI